MGKNYYLHMDTCKCCGRSRDKYHIGKSSVGWVFSLHVDPDQGINNLDDVFNLIETSKGKIKDEYGTDVYPETLKTIITARSGTSDFSDKNFPKRDQYWPYDSWEDFHEKNHSMEGPNNLLRHKINGSHCIGHGEGTWDYIKGEFS